MLHASCPQSYYVAKDASPSPTVFDELLAYLDVAFGFGETFIGIVRFLFVEGLVASVKLPICLACVAHFFTSFILGQCLLVLRLAIRICMWVIICKI